MYVCENLFDESKRQIVPRGGDPKRYVHSEAVLQDEVYHFRRLLVLRKQPLATIQQEASERIKSLFAEAVGVRGERSEGGVEGRDIWGGRVALKVVCKAIRE